MWHEEMELNWSITGEFEDDDEGLDEHELSRLQFFAEHPELADPLIWFLPETKSKKRR